MYHRWPLHVLSFMPLPLGWDCSSQVENSPLCHGLVLSSYSPFAGDTFCARRLWFQSLCLATKCMVAEPQPGRSGEGLRAIAACPKTRAAFLHGQVILRNSRPLWPHANGLRNPLRTPRGKWQPLRFGASCMARRKQWCDTWILKSFLAKEVWQSS